MTKWNITMKNEIWFLSCKHSVGEIYGKNEKRSENILIIFHESKTSKMQTKPQKPKNWVKQWKTPKSPR